MYSEVCLPVFTSISFFLLLAWCLRIKPVLGFILLVSCCSYCFVDLHFACYCPSCSDSLQVAVNTTRSQNH